METDKNVLNQWGAAPAVRRAGRICPPAFPAYNFIMPCNRTCCARGFSVAAARPVLIAAEPVLWERGCLQRAYPRTLYSALPAP